MWFTAILINDHSSLIQFLTYTHRLLHYNVPNGHSRIAEAARAPLLPVVMDIPDINPTRAPIHFKKTDHLLLTAFSVETAYVVQLAHTSEKFCNGSLEDGSRSQCFLWWLRTHRSHSNIDMAIRIWPSFPLTSTYPFAIPAPSSFEPYYGHADGRFLRHRKALWIHWRQCWHN